MVDFWRSRADGNGLSAVSLHGGYFMPEYTRALHAPIALELAHRGFTIWNVEYRRAPEVSLAETTADVRTAVDFVSAESPSARLAVFGHAPGGYLAAWVASHRLATSWSRSARSRISWTPSSQAAMEVRSPRPAERVSVSGDQPGTPRGGDLRRRWPTGATQVLVHGVYDETVPTSQSRAPT